MGWFEKAAQLATRDRLPRAMRRLRLSIPRGANLLVGRVFRGLGQPAFAYESLGNTGFIYSWDRYWPASTLKIMAAVGALMRLRKWGITGESSLRFRDDYGAFRGKLKEIIRRALVQSTNKDYDRLVRLATVDALNQKILSPAFGLPLMKIRCPYGGSRSLRWSPRIRYRNAAGQAGAIPSHRSRRDGDPRCPFPQNCTTLFELQESLRRIVLHERLPASHRFPIDASDVRWIRQALLDAKSPISPVAKSILGRRVKIYNKAGSYPPRDHLDNAWLRGPKASVFLSLSVPYSKRHKTTRSTRRLLRRWAKASLEAWKRTPYRGPLLQESAGVALKIAAEALANGRFKLWVRGPLSVARVEAWAARKHLKLQKQEGSFAATFSSRGLPENVLFTVAAFTKERRKVSHQSRVYRLRRPAGCQ